MTQPDWIGSMSARLSRDFMFMNRAEVARILEQEIADVYALGYQHGHDDPEGMNPYVRTAAEVHAEAMRAIRTGRMMSR